LNPRRFWVAARVSSSIACITFIHVLPSGARVANLICVFGLVSAPAAKCAERTTSAAAAVRTPSAKRECERRRCLEKLIFLLQ
jgi:hypothetical protein